MKLRCRDDTVPKTVDTRSHCKVWLRACNNLPQPPPYISVFWGCGRLLHALNHTLQWLLVSTVFGTVSSLHLNFIFNDFYTCIITSVKIIKNEMKCTEVQNPRRSECIHHVIYIIHHQRFFLRSEHLPGAAARVRPC